MDLKGFLKEIFKHEQDTNVFYKKDVVAVDTETDANDNLTNVSLYSRTKEGELCRVFTKEELNDIFFFDLIDNCLVVFFQESFDIRVIFSFFKIRVYSVEILVASKQRAILSKYSFNIRGREYCFYSFDLRNIFTCRLSDVSKIVCEYFKLKNIQRIYYVNKGDFTISSNELQKGIDIDGVHYDNAVDIISKLKEKYGDAYYKSREFLMYSMKDSIITFEGFLYYPLIFSEILGIKCNRRMTISSLAFDMYNEKCADAVKKNVFENFSYSRVFYGIKQQRKGVDGGLKCKTKNNSHVYVYKPMVFSFLRKGYSGGLTYIRDSNVFKDIVCFDINSAYPYALSVISPNVFSKIFRINVRKIDEKEKIFFDNEEVYKDFFEFNTSYEYYKTNLNELKTAFDITKKQAISDTKTIVETLCDEIGFDLNELLICKRYKYLVELFRLALKGRVVGVVCGILKSIDENSLGLSMSIKNYYSANIVGNGINRFVVMNFYDIIRLNADIDVYDILIIFNNDRELGLFIKDTYEKRVEYKKQNNSFESAVKLFLNSIYGKFGSMNLSLRKISYNLNFESLLHLLELNPDSSNLSLNKYSNKTIDFDVSIDDDNRRMLLNVMIKEFDGISVLFLTEKKKILRDYNVIFASSITAFVRLLLEMYQRYFKRKYETVLLYSDTDSLHLKINRDLLDKITRDAFVHNSNLGYLKYEGYFVEGYYAKKKCYLLFDDKNAIKVKFKGSSRIRRLEKERLKKAFFSLINGRAITLVDLRYAPLFANVLFEEFDRYVYPPFEVGVSSISSYRNRAVEYFKTAGEIIKNLRNNAYRL